MVRETLWFGGVDVLQVIGTPGTALLLTSLSAGALDLRPFTVIRTRGMLGIRSDQVAATEDQLAAYGHAVVADQAVAIGVTAVPTPVTDNDSDLWFVLERIMSDMTFSTAAAHEKQGNYASFDSKAMRKVEDGQDLISVVETPAVGIAAGCVFKAYFRRLVKLH